MLKKDYTIRAGNSFTLPVKVAYTDGEPVNISNWAVKIVMKICQSLPDDEAVLIKSKVLDNTHTNGVFGISLSPTETKTIDPLTYYYEVNICSDYGVSVTPLSGFMKFNI